MGRLPLAFLVAALAASQSLALDNSPPGFSQLQVTDCNDTPRSGTTNIGNPRILLKIQDSQSGLHRGNAALIAGSSTPASTNLFWTFDAGGAIIADDSLHNETGILQGATGADCGGGQDPCFDAAGGPPGTGFGKNLHFIASRPPTNQQPFGVVRPPALSTASLDNIFSAVTVESWVKLDYSTGPRTFIEFSTATRPVPTDEKKGPTIRFGTIDGTTLTNGDGAIWVDLISTGNGVAHHKFFTAANTLDLNWHLVTVTYNSANGAAFIYVDGVQKASAPVGSVALRTDSEFRVGYSTADALGLTFQGRLDQFRVLPRAVSVEEALQVFDGGRIRVFRKNFPNPSLYRVAVGGDYVDGFTGQVSFDKRVQVLTGGFDLSVGTNTVEFVVSDRGGNFQTLTGVLNLQTSAPGAPTLTSVAPSGAGGITYSWTQPAGICTTNPPTYRIYTCADVPAGVPDVTTLSNTEVIGAPNVNVKAGRKISAIDNVLIAESAKSACGQSYTNADPPAGLTGDPTGISTGGVRLTWSRGANPLYTRFQLMGFPTPARVPGQETILIGLNANFTGTSAGVGGLAPGTSYFFSVFAYNGDAADLGTPGGIANATPATADVATTVEVSTVTARALNTTTIQWDWRGTTGADFYRVVNATNPATILCQGGKATFCTGVFPESCKCTSGGYSSDTLVSAFLQASGPPPSPAGVPSNTASAFTLAIQPIAFAGTAVTSNTASLSWNGNGNSQTTNFEIRRSTSATMFGTISTTSAQGTSAVIVGLFPASTYFFQLRARNGDEFFTAPAATTVQAVTLPSNGITSSSGPPTAYEAPNGAIAVWHFDENAGTLAIDSSGNRHDGVLTCDFAGCSSTPTYVAGPAGLGTALRFVGQSGSYVHVSTSAGFNNPPGLTVEAWVNPSTAFQTPEATVIAKGSSTDFGFSLDVDNSGGVQRWRFRIGNNSGGANTCGAALECLTAPALLDPGKWHHLLAVWNPAGPSQQIYIDGTLAVNRALVVNTFRNLTARVTLGNRPFGGTAAYNAAFAGSLDEVRVLNRAVNAAEAAQEYAGGLSGTFAAPPPNEKIRLSIPPNAFGGPVRVFVSGNPLTNPLKTSPAAINTGLSLPPTGFTLVPGSLIEIVAQVNGQTFTDPLGSSVTVSLPYTDDDGNDLVDGTSPPLDVARLVVYTLEETPPRWVALPTTVDRTTRRVSGLTPHFSIFALFGTSGVGSGDDVSVFPVPWLPGSGGRFDSVTNCNGGLGLCFDKLSTQGTIRIFTITGEMVIELPFTAVNAGKIAWDGRNAARHQVASGVYFARINGFTSGTRIIKFAIER